MYVIVEIAGQQFKAEKGRKLYVHRLPGEENSSVSFDKVLLADICFGTFFGVSLIV
jgi:large subunit ribosomal protein L21